jgi:hypothetical protein
MKIKHYNPELLEEIHRRFNEIRKIIDRKNLSRLNQSSCMLQKNSRIFRSSTRMYEEMIQEEEEKILKYKEQINEHVHWLWQNAPDIMRRLERIRPFITTWTLDLNMTQIGFWSQALGTYCLLPNVTKDRFTLNLSIKKSSPLKNLRSTQTLEERLQTIRFRWEMMTKWFEFFCGKVTLDENRT